MSLWTNIVEHFRHRLDIEVSMEYFSCKSSLSSSIKVATFLYIDSKERVQAVGHCSNVQSDWRKSEVFSDIAHFDVAASILKFALEKLQSQRPFFIRPIVYFHGVESVPEHYFYFSNELDQQKVRLHFFKELGLACGGRESHVQS